jgi:hypothetical protein
MPTDPEITWAEACFNARDFIVTDKNIRDSFQFNDIYQKYYIDQLHPHRFYFLNNIKSFNFNYDYQIGSSPNDIKNILNPEGSNIPKYLADMQAYFAPQLKVRSLAIEAAFKFSKQNNKQIVNPTNEASSVKKLFESGIRLFAAYPSDAKNGSRYIYLKLKNILPKILKEV